MGDAPPPDDAAPSPESATPSGTDGPSSDDRNLAVLTHLLGILTSFIGALVIWLIKKDTSDYLARQSREALNFQITVLMAWVIASLTIMIGVGCVLAPAVWVLDIVFCILAAVACSKGEDYRYPFALRLIS